MTVLFPNSQRRVHLQDSPFRAVGKKNMHFELVEKAKRNVFRHRESNPGLAGTVQ